MSTLSQLFAQLGPCRAAPVSSHLAQGITDRSQLVDLTHRACTKRYILYMHKMKKRENVRAAVDLHCLGLSPSQSQVQPEGTQHSGAVEPELEQRLSGESGAAAAVGGGAGAEQRQALQALGPEAAGHLALGTLSGSQFSGEPSSFSDVPESPLGAAAARRSSRLRPGFAPSSSAMHSDLPESELPPSAGPSIAAGPAHCRSVGCAGHRSALRHMHPGPECSVPHSSCCLQRSMHHAPCCELRHGSDMLPRFHWWTSPWPATLLEMHRASPCSARVYNVVMSYMVTQTSQYLTSASLCCTLLRLTDILYAWPSDILNTAVMQSRRFTVTHSSVLNHAGCSNACSENETLDHNRSSLVFVARL